MEDRDALFSTLERYGLRFGCTQEVVVRLSGPSAADMSHDVFRNSHGAQEAYAALDRREAEQHAGPEMLPLEEAVVLGLEAADDPRVVYGLPALLYNGREDLDPWLLRDLALRRGVANQLGYVLDVCFEHFAGYFERGGGLDAVRKELKGKKGVKEVPFYREQDDVPELLEHRLKNRSPLLEEWNLLAHFDPDGFRSAFELYAQRVGE